MGHHHSMPPQFLPTAPSLAPIQIGNAHANANGSGNGNGNVSNYQPIMFPAMIPLIQPPNHHHDHHGNNNVINEDDIFGNKFIPNNANQFVFFKQNDPIKANHNAKKRKREEQESEDENDEDDEDEDEGEDDADSYDDDDYNPLDDGANSETIISNVQRMPLSKKRKLSNKNKSNSKKKRHHCTYCNKSFMQNSFGAAHSREAFVDKTIV